jgi:peptide/nickel transport system permease protein
MATTTAEGIPATRRAAGISLWDYPWLNPKLLIGATIVVLIILMGVLGRFVWDITLAQAASSPLNLPPFWVQDPRHPPGDPAHPLGTDNMGRDMLALIITGLPSSLRIGFIAAGVGMLVGIVLGFTSGFLGGWVDNVIRTVTDAALTIPQLLVLVTLAAYIRPTVTVMALLLAAFAWRGPTRLIRAQALSMRERGYVRMARLSASSTLSIILVEMMPNLLPYLAASLAGNISGNILAATGLELLGLGPTRVPTLGMTIYYSIRASAVLRGMWWWWGFPILALVVIFTSFFLMAVGLDEIANPRLRQLQVKEE